MESINREAVLEEARLALAVGKGIYEDNLYRRLHALAESGDEAAKAFFVITLRSEDPDWRLEAVRNLGFHYYLKPDIAIVAQIRHLLVSDPDDDVRLAAAAVLGIRSMWPDKALYHAMTDDSNEFVRLATFESLLALAGKSYNEVRRIMARIGSGELPVTRESLKALIGEKYSELVEDNN